MVHALLATCIPAAAIGDRSTGGVTIDAWESITAFPATETGPLPRALSSGIALMPGRAWVATLSLEATGSLWLPIPVVMATIGPAWQFRPSDVLWLSAGPELSFVSYPDLGEPKGE